MNRQEYAFFIMSMKTSPITANASQLGIPINRRFPMTLSGGASLERLGRVRGLSVSLVVLYPVFVHRIGKLLKRDV